MFEPEQCAREILGQLVRIRTTQPAGDEKDAVLFLKEIFAPFPGEIGVLDHGANRASMILTMPGRDRGRAVAVTGHLDTVKWIPRRPGRTRPSPPSATASGSMAAERRI